MDSHPSTEPPGRVSSCGGIAAPEGYLAETRGLALSFLFIVPLLAAYEIGLICFRPDYASWAGGVIRDVLHTILGPRAMLGFNAVGLAAVLGAVWSLRRGLRGRAMHLPGVMLESAVYALFFGTVVLWLMKALNLPVAMEAPANAMGGLADNIVLAIGAGVYEEIFFRLGLLTGIAVLLRRWPGLKAPAATVIAVVVSSLLFAACHHVQFGLTGGFHLRWAEAFSWGAFSFRLVSGGVFGVLYLVRGLAVAAWTHAFYDIIFALSH